MEIASFRHQSDSRYCFALDDHHVLIRLAAARSVQIESVEIIYGDPMSFVGKHQSQPCYLKHTDAGFHYFETVIEIYPSRIMYVFRVKGEGRECYVAESGLFDSYRYDLGFISAFQFVGENPNDFVIDREKWRGKVIYQIFVERFAQGLPNKDYVNTKWDCKSLVGKHRAQLGGDLQGIINKLDYLEDLGVEAIYLTPIHPSPSNHKYDVLDYYDVDTHFGGKKVFKELSDQLHQRKMLLMMDMVFNHTSSSHPFFLDVCSKGKSSPYYSWYFVDGEKPRKQPLNYRCFGTVTTMPKLNTNNKDVQKYLIDVICHYVKEYGVDGFRLDVSEGVSHDLWIKMKLALKEINPNIILIGENWLNSESYLGVNQLDGVMNYPFLGVTCGYVLRINDARGTAEGLEGLLMRYKDGFSKMMMNLLASHDIQRFTTLCKNNKDCSLIGYAILMFYWGYPLIYYGEEIFMRGGGDPDNRRGMEWDSEMFQSYYHKTFKSLIHLRKNPVLKEGDIQIYEDRGLLVIRRAFAGESLVLYCNMTDQGVVVRGNVILSNHYAGNQLWKEGFAVVEE